MKYFNNYLLFTFVGIALLACQPSTEKQVDDPSSQTGTDPNPHAEGFNAEGSDQEAVAIADLVMESMGGRKAWDKTRFLCWDFFGARHLIWDKQDHRVRIETGDSTIYLVNVEDLTGKVFKDGMELTNPDSLATYLQRGKEIWINDSYWLVMPFKLKDSGVTLKYKGEDLTKEGDMAEVLELTFDGVGKTPENKYLVYVDKEEHLVTQWAYYNKAEQDSANFVRPWGNYKKHGSIMLSDERGDRDLSEVMVVDALPDKVFNSFDPVDLSKLVDQN